jgi:hypothetical protein
MTKRSQRRKREEYGYDSDGITGIKTALTYVDAGSHKATVTFTSSAATGMNEEMVYAYGGTINWGDTNSSAVGADSTYSAGTVGNVNGNSVGAGVFKQSHTYSGAGTFTVTWTPLFGPTASVSVTVA